MTATLEEATRSFYEALNAMLGGNVSPMLALWSHADDVTYMSPFGELLVGWEPIRDSGRSRRTSISGAGSSPKSCGTWPRPRSGSWSASSAEPSSRSTERRRSRCS